VARSETGHSAREAGQITAALGYASRLNGFFWLRVKTPRSSVKTAAFCFDWQERLEKAGGRSATGFVFGLASDRFVRTVAVL
jgi:hypothetical protein